MKDEDREDLPKIDAKPRAPKQIVEKPVTVWQGIEVVNKDKWVRAVEGSMTRAGDTAGGVGEDADMQVKLTAYDRLGGLLRKDGHNIKTGCFFNFKTKRPHTEIKLIFEFRDLQGRRVEVPEGKPIPMEVRAAQIAKGERVPEDTEEEEVDETPKKKVAKKKVNEEEE